LVDRKEDNGIVRGYFSQEGGIEMLWVLIAASIFTVGLLFLLRRRIKKKVETDIAY